ncbi:MAG: hypothetical protein IJN83_01420 [Clostridia bacterium]|nr:hypothetical protein [Clostridia bacterium]
MKKIFAIALALVMVLSMASAFASYCTAGFDWTCATDATYCGQGKVEVVPFVKVNNACGGFEYEESTCAAAVASENIYWAVKLTVDANPDMEWWNEAKLVVEAKETNYKTKTWDFSKKADKAGIDFTEDETVVYYALIKANAKHEVWIDVEDEDLDLNDVVFSARVNKNAKAANVKVCATLTSLGEDFYDGIVGDYYVVYDASPVAKEGKFATLTAPYSGEDVSKLYVGDATTSADATGWTIEVKDGKIVATAKKAQKIEDKLDIWEKGVPGSKHNAKLSNGAAPVVATDDVLTIYDKKENGTWLVEYIIVDGKVRVINTNNACGTAAYATTKAFFGIEIDTCIDQDIINANFGWDFEQEFCLPWSANASSIVDTECVVAIPKTGDASVLAWLF